MKGGEGERCGWSCLWTVTENCEWQWW